MLKHLSLGLLLVTWATSIQALDYSVLGFDKWDRLRPGWSLTVNDQGLYEFVFQFEHDDTLPMGERNFKDMCVFKDPVTKLPFVADDGMEYLEPRKFWERFPPYVWATIGFNHLSIDWYPCGHRPEGYSLPHYDFSFFRVTPEFRIHTMVCDMLVDNQVVVPGEEVCDFNQDHPTGMGFNILPAALINRNPVVNMPVQFTRPELGNGPLPHVGMRSWDQVKLPTTPNQWHDSPVFMSSYAGDLVMWQAHIPHRRVSGTSDVFTSNRYQYHETTIDTLPDTHAFDWDVEEGVARFHMIGKSGLSRANFEAAEAEFGGPPVFPNWDDVLNGGGNGNGNGNGDDDQGSGDDGGNGSSGYVERMSTLSVLVSFSLLCWLR